MNDVSSALIKRCVQVITDQLESVIVVYHFGSTANNESRPESDIDFAVLCDKEIPAVKRFNLSAALADICNRDVDIVDLVTAGEGLKIEILSKGVPVFISDDDRRAEFEMYALVKYAKLNEERAALLEDFFKK